MARTRLFRMHWPSASFAVGRIRARCLAVRLPNPPLEPCWRLSSHTAHERRTLTGNFHFANSTEFTVSLRVRWLPLYRFPYPLLRAFAMYVAFLHSAYYASSDCL